METDKKDEKPLNPPKEEDSLTAETSEPTTEATINTPESTLTPVPDVETEPTTGAHMNNIDPDPQTALETMDPEASPADKAKVFSQPKKSHKKVFAIIAAVLVLFVAGAVAYYFLFMQPKPVADTPTVPKTISKDSSELKSEASAVTEQLTQGATDETDITNTDDSSYSTDTDTSAATVGDSVDENTF